MTAQAPPLSKAELRNIDAYWRAANYLSVGQIYRYDNPLLKKPLTLAILPGDDHVAPDGRVMEMLSEHQCQGWLDGYLLSGRHGFFPCYEAFIHIIDSMFNQHAKWLKVSNEIPWRRPIASLNYLPDLKVRVINVVNLMKLQPQSEHPHGLSDKEFDVLFTTDKSVIFAYHGYPLLIHRLTYRRTNHHNLHVRGYKEEGTTTTPFDMVVLNDLDRFHLVADVIDRVPALGPRAAHAQQVIRDKLIEHKQYIARYGEDMPEIRDWRWSLDTPARRPRRRSNGSPRRSKS